VKTFRSLGALTFALAVGAAGCRSRPREAQPSGPAISARLERRLSGHTKHVWSVAFSPDGRTLASASVDGTVRLWPLGGGADAAPRVLRHPQGVTSVDVSPDGTRIATASYDGIVRVWRARDGVLERALTGHSGTVWTLEFSPDGRWLASGGEDKTVRVWRVSDGALARTIPAHDRIVWSVAFSPDSRLLASASFDRTIKLWRVEDGSLARVLRGHGQAVLEARFTPDGSLLVSGGDDSTVRVWRVAASMIRSQGDQPINSRSASSMSWKVSDGVIAARRPSRKSGRSISRASRARTCKWVRSSRQATRKKMSVSMPVTASI